MTHTPGPWFAASNHGCKNIGPRVSARMIAPVADTVGLDESTDRDNARLIAAAPEMLAALEMVMDRVLVYSACEVDCSHVEGECESAVAVRAAIRKATGE